MKLRILLPFLLLPAACADRADEPAPEASNAADETSMPAPEDMPTPDGPVSFYTDLTECPVAEEFEEGGGFRREPCPGPEGWTVVQTESDLRAGFTVIAPDGERTNLDLSSTVANGTFNQLGTMVEWRGSAGEDPQALIVRLNIAPPEGVSEETSKLVVSRLGPEPCIIDIIEPGEGQNERARASADEEPLKLCMNQDV